MAESNVAPASYVGSAVAKAWLDSAGRPSGATWRVANAPTDRDLGALVERLQQVAPQVVVREATGGDERAIVAALAVAGVPGAVVNPR
jgi:transposase